MKAGEAVLAVGATGYAAQLDTGRASSVTTLGVADRETGRKVNAEHEFQMGSNTKTMVAAVALQLVGEGTLGIDDNIHEWRPGTVPGGNAITVRMLLQHTSGLFDYAPIRGWGRRFFLILSANGLPRNSLGLQSHTGRFSRRERVGRIRISVSFWWA